MKSCCCVTTVMIALIAFHGNAHAGKGDFSRGMALTVKGGASVARIAADGLARHLFEPTSRVETVSRPRVLVEVNWFMNRFVGLAAGMGNGSYHRHTPATSVELRGDPFPHMLETEITLNYFVVPLSVVLGYAGSRHGIWLRGGPVLSRLMEEEVSWKIDDREMTNGRYAPVYELDRNNVALHAGVEYELRLGSNGIVAAATYEYGIHNLVDSPEGEAAMRSRMVLVGYRRHF